MLTVISIVGVVFFILFLYFTIKQIEFVLVATNLYRDMVKNQKDIIVLLKDIRDGSKLYVVEVPEIIECPHCSTMLRLTRQERKSRTTVCVKCKNTITM